MSSPPSRLPWFRSSSLAYSISPSMPRTVIRSVGHWQHWLLRVVEQAKVGAGGKRRTEDNQQQPGEADGDERELRPVRHIPERATEQRSQEGDAVAERERHAGQPGDGGAAEEQRGQPNAQRKDERRAASQ